MIMIMKDGMIMKHNDKDNKKKNKNKNKNQNDDEDDVHLLAAGGSRRSTSSTT